MHTCFVSVHLKVDLAALAAGVADLEGNRLLACGLHGSKRDERAWWQRRTNEQHVNLPKMPCMCIAAVAPALELSCRRGWLPAEKAVQTDRSHHCAAYYTYFTLMVVLASTSTVSGHSSVAPRTTLCAATGVAAPANRQRTAKVSPRRHLIV